jgi:BCD family chlorophyll transporter-like MFS transporter
MHLAPKDQSGLALGAWGAVQATAGGLAMALGGIARDVVDMLMGSGLDTSVSTALKYSC